MKVSISNSVYLELSKYDPVSYEDDKKGVYCGFKIAGGPGYHQKVGIVHDGGFAN